MLTGGWDAVVKSTRGGSFARARGWGPCCSGTRPSFPSFSRYLSGHCFCDNNVPTYESCDKTNMASTQALSSAANDRKARLAQLKSLKRKQPESDDHTEQAVEEPSQSEALTDKPKYLSGRNYDHETQGPKLGFESAPSEGKETLERKAEALALETKRQAEEEEKTDKPLDLFKLQPKKPNWDLKRDLDRKMEVLNVRTDNAIARLVRERISSQQKAAQARTAAAGNANGSGDSEAAGIEGTTLVEATNVREREDEEEARREREEEAALLDGS